MRLQTGKVNQPVNKIKIVNQQDLDQLSTMTSGPVETDKKSLYTKPLGIRRVHSNIL